MGAQEFNIRSPQEGDVVTPASLFLFHHSLEWTAYTSARNRNPPEGHHSSTKNVDQTTRSRRPDLRCWSNLLEGADQERYHPHAAPRFPEPLGVQRFGVAYTVNPENSWGSTVSLGEIGWLPSSRSVLLSDPSRCLTLENPQRF